MKVLLILLFLWDGEVTEYRKLYDGMKACEVGGKATMAEKQRDPRFGEGLYAVCVEQKVVEAKGDK